MIPPTVVAVVGPPSCGKTTLIRSLVKRFCRQNLKTVKGPITVNAGRSRRITFIECTQDLNVMSDVARCVVPRPGIFGRICKKYRPTERFNDSAVGKVVLKNVKVGGKWLNLSGERGGRWVSWG